LPNIPAAGAAKAAVLNHWATLSGPCAEAPVASGRVAMPRRRRAGPTQAARVIRSAGASVARTNQRRRTDERAQVNAELRELGHHCRVRELGRR